MQLIELEQVDAVLEALLKASVNRIPKLALAATNAILAVRISARRKSSRQRHFEGLVPLFDAKDAKVRAAAKDITVEMTKWLGAAAVKRDLIDKMRESMQADVNKAISSAEGSLGRRESCGEIKRRTTRARRPRATSPAFAMRRPLNRRPLPLLSPRLTRTNIRNQSRFCRSWTNRARGKSKVLGRCRE